MFKKMKLMVMGLLCCAVLMPHESKSSTFSAAMDKKTEAVQFKEQADHLAAAQAYEAAADLGLNINHALWNGVEQYLKAEKPAEALRLLKRLASVGDASMNHLQTIEAQFKNEPDMFQSIKKQFEVNSTSKSLEKASDPIISTEDLHHFFHAFDLSLGKNFEDQVAIYRTHYIDVATPGMVDFFTFKISSTENFVTYVEQARPFYQDLKVATANIDSLKQKAMQAMQAMQTYVSGANIPDIYFVVGMHTSAGTVSDKGILLGADFIAVDSKNLHLIPSWTQPFLSSPEDKVWVIMHEYMHYLQNTDHKTLLGTALIEGGADYLANKIYGEPVKPMKYTAFGLKHEERIKRQFMNDIDSTDLSRWSGNNSTQFDDEWVADLAYFVGAQIAAGYVKNSPDEKQAIIDLLELKDIKAIANRSQYFDETL